MALRSIEFLIGGYFVNPPVAEEFRDIKRTATKTTEKIIAKFAQVSGLVQLEFGGVFPNRAKQGFPARVVADNATIGAQLINRHSFFC